MNKNLLYTLIILLLPCLSACNMEKEIDLALPAYESKMVIECYLEPGKPYRLLITESVSYFEGLNLPTVDNALVIISHNNIIDTLKFNPYVDQLTNKFYNYRSTNIVPADYASIFFLEVIDTKGRIATSNTSILKPIPIDTIEFKYNEDSLATPLTKFKDNTTTIDYIRYMVIKADTTTNQNVIANYSINDALLNSADVSISSGYKVKKNDSISVFLYHIHEDYFKFLESIDLAQDANGNPFGQPATIKSNIQGGLGIFTGLSGDIKHLRVP